MIVLFFNAIVCVQPVIISITLRENNPEAIRGMIKSKKSSVLTEFAKKVRNRRLGLTQEELAEKANFHVNYIGGIERAERNISLEKIVELAYALRLSPKNHMPE